MATATHTTPAAHQGSTTQEGPMTHSVTHRPMPANENGRGNLAGTALSCTCGWTATTSLATMAQAEGAAHLRWHLDGQARVARALRQGRR
jgi:hypothetical protein